MSIADRLTAARDRITAACERSGRDPAEVELLPVSKWHPTRAITEAHAAGWRRFGESRPQELAAKAQELEPLGLSWVAIGHLQTNKARLVAEHAAEFQALDSLRLGEALHRRLAALDRRLPVLVEVNTSGEQAKGGFAPAEVVGAVRALRQYPTLEVRGLMTLAVRSADTLRVRACFTGLVEVQARLRDVFGDGFSTLSMGMSEDYELAIGCGSTCVRLGTAVFGSRPDR
ncbi:MAG: YggS family pyridoxal phosphate-dependent enzyme [Propioniciclava sp.]